MIEPLDVVWISRLSSPNRRYRYHRPDREHAVFQVTTRCQKLQLLDCEPVSEIEAVLKHDPCLRCFPIRHRRQRILNQIAADELVEAVIRSVDAGVEDA